MTLYDESPIAIFSTSPQSKDLPRETYVQQVIDVARWSEEAGCTGILVYTDNSLVDPWLVSQIILQNTEQLCPLIAIQPVYMHPYTAAKMITSFGHLYGRRVYLNMVAGGFKNDLLALNDTTPHDDRYVKLIEYTTIIKLLLSSHDPVSFAGKFYKVEKLWMWPFENYKTFCPYLVGSYQEVSEELSAYLQIGYRTFILDIPPNREELQNVQIVFQMASERAL